MQYIIDHDLHIHSQLSLCSGHPEQTPARILQYAVQNHYSTICLTDHYWDESVPGAPEWYQIQNTEHIRRALPLPQAKGVRFLFGCETDMDKYSVVGISDKMLNELDFVIVPLNHLHMMGFTIDPENGSTERRADWFIRRFDTLLGMDLPFEKIGIAHFTCRLIDRNTPRSHIELYDMISDDTYRELFGRAAAKGCGIELNFPIGSYQGADLDSILRPYRIAADCGCKFYFGSDAHVPQGLDDALPNFTAIRDALGLTEDQKFTV